MAAITISYWGPPELGIGPSQPDLKPVLCPRHPSDTCNYVYHIAQKSLHNQRRLISCGVRSPELYYLDIIANSLIGNVRHLLPSRTELDSNI